MAKLCRRKKRRPVYFLKGYSLASQKARQTQAAQVRRPPVEIRC